jgi:hypothetical protein
LEARDTIPLETEKSGAVKEAIPVVVVVAKLLLRVIVPSPFTIETPVPAVMLFRVYPPLELPIRSFPEEAVELSPVPPLAKARVPVTLVVPRLMAENVICWPERLR